MVNFGPEKYQKWVQMAGVVLNDAEIQHSDLEVLSKKCAPRQFVGVVYNIL